MGAWGFVSLAYGIVWGSILVYLILLKRRYASAAAELERLLMDTTNRITHRVKGQ
jgi:CcmD family protein